MNKHTLDATNDAKSLNITLYFTIINRNPLMSNGSIVKLRPRKSGVRGLN